MAPRPLFAARIPADLNNRVGAHMEQTGASKAELLIEALEVYLNRLESDGGAEVAALRQQVMELEARFTALEEAVIGDVGQPLAVVEMPRVRKVAALQYGQS